MEESVKLRELEEVIEEVSNNHKDIWDSIMDKKIGELSRDELLDFFKITLEGVEKIRAKREKAVEK